MRRYTVVALLFVGLNFAAAQGLKEAEELVSKYQFQKALTVLEALPDTAGITVPLQSGYCYYRLGNFKLAIDRYNKALQLDSTNQVALMQLGQLYPRNGESDKAKRCYEKLIALDSTNSFYYKQFATFESSVNDMGVSLKLYSKSLALNPTDMESYASLGAILLELDDFIALDTLLKRGLARDSTQASLLVLQAKSQMGQQQYRGAVKTLGKLLDKKDTIPAYARLLGISYFQLNEYPNVVKCMNFLLNSNLKSEWVYYYLGVSYRELNDLPRSIEYMDKAIEEGISDNLGIYYSQLARTFEEKKDYKNAIHYYKAAYEKSKSKIMLYHLARNYDVYYKDKTTAIAYYKQYLLSDDTIKIAREYSRHRLNRLSDN
jgi:tetratricopeptide (TPR) repeat protein